MKGKLVGVSSRGGSNDLMMEIILQKNRLAPNKDVTTLIDAATRRAIKE